MKKLNISSFWRIFLVFLLIGTTSCLEMGLEELPAFEDAEITNVQFEFRYKDMNDLWIDGEPIVKVINLTVGDRVISSENGTVTCRLTVPATNASFTADIRNGVSLQSIVGKFNISTGASITPVGGAPQLGIPGDFSTPRTYNVIAADGTVKSWQITITNLTK